MKKNIWGWINIILLWIFIIHYWAGVAGCDGEDNYDEFVPNQTIEEEIKFERFEVVTAQRIGFGLFVDVIRDKETGIEYMIVRENGVAVTVMYRWQPQ